METVNLIWICKWNSSWNFKNLIHLNAVGCCWLICVVESWVWMCRVNSSCEVNRLVRRQLTTASSLTLTRVYRQRNEPPLQLSIKWRPSLWKMTRKSRRWLADPTEFVQLFNHLRVKLWQFAVRNVQPPSRGTSKTPQSPQRNRLEMRLQSDDFLPPKNHWMLTGGSRFISSFSHNLQTFYQLLAMQNVCK